MMAKVRLSGHIIVAEKDLAAVEAALPEHIRLTLLEPGCLSFTVRPSEKQSGRFDVDEEFRDQTAFDAHQARVKASAWGKITKDVERHYTITTD